jgi:putative SOS response-associated peptidase YedK
VIPKKTTKPKAGSRPVYKLEMPDGALYALAGLYSERRPGREVITLHSNTFSIVTTEANEFTKSIHNRMPVIYVRAITTAGSMITTNRDR